MGGGAGPGTGELSRWGYPRPQLERADWTCLNGTWQCALEREPHWRTPDDVAWERTIEVPFAP